MRPLERHTAGERMAIRDPFRASRDPFFGEASAQKSIYLLHSGFGPYIMKPRSLFENRLIFGKIAERSVLDNPYHCARVDAY